MTTDTPSDEERSTASARFTEYSIKVHTIYAMNSLSYSDAVLLGKFTKVAFMAMQTMNGQPDLSKSRPTFGHEAFAVALQYVDYWCRQSAQEIKYVDADVQRLHQSSEFDRYWVDKGPSKNATDTFMVLFEAAKSDKFYFRVSQFFASYCLSTNVSLPDCMARFASLCIMEEFPRPNTQKQHPMQTHARNNFIFYDVSFLVTKGFDATSKKENGTSACHAIAEGWGMTVSAVESIYKKLKAKHSKDEVSSVLKKNQDPIFKFEIFEEGKS